MQPGFGVRYLPQEPDFSGFASTLAYVEAGLGPSDDDHPRAISSSSSACTATKTRRISPAARRAAPRWPGCWRPRPTSCCSTSRPTISISPPSNGSEGELDSRRTALVIISHDRRFLSTLSREHGLARPWPDAPHRARICPFRGMARRGAGRGGARPAQARPQDRRRGALAALRRLRPAQAQHSARWRAASATRAAPDLSRHRRRRDDQRRRGGAVRALVIEATGIGKSLGGRADRQRLLDPHPARRPHRHRRAERQRQDHADQHADRRARARYGHRAARLESGGGDARSAPRQPRLRTSPAETDRRGRATR